MSGGVYEGDGIEAEGFFPFLYLRWKKSKGAVMGCRFGCPFFGVYHSDPRPEGFVLGFWSGVRDWIIGFGLGVRWGTWIARVVALVYLEVCALQFIPRKETTRPGGLEVIATVAVDVVWVVMMIKMETFNSGAFQAEVLPRSSRQRQEVVSWQGLQHI